jgi:PST family polysaccharide transporter
MLQGLRRIGDIARLQVSAVVVGTVVSIVLYALLRERGIVPVFLVSAVINLSISFGFARRIEIAPVTITWSETFAEARGLVGLGIAFMWSALLTAAVGLLIQSLVRERFGIDGNGIYQAAWSISGVFAGFILGAMGTDFYPRLTAAAADNDAMNRLVNEQTEVGILLALPGLLATLCFSPWVIQLLYSARFANAAELLPWFVLGVFGRVISWPMGYVQLAKGAGRWFMATESMFAALQVLLVWLGLHWLGLRGVAVSFALLYAAYTVGMLWTTSRLSRFRWSSSVWRLLIYSSVAVLGSFLLSQWLPAIPLAAAGSVLVMVVAVLSLRQLIRRVGTQHRLARIPLRIPVLGPFLAR